MRIDGDERSLTDRDAEILRDLAAWMRDGGWARTRDLGGRRGTDHSRRLNRMAQFGYVEARLAQNWEGPVGGKVYRASDAGRTVSAAIEAARAAPEAPEEVSDAE
jgi:hypothetical protein